MLVGPGQRELAATIASSLGFMMLLSLANLSALAEALLFLHILPNACFSPALRWYFFMCLGE